MWGKLEKMPKPRDFYQDDSEIIGMGERPPEYVPVQYRDIEIPGLKGSVHFHQEVELGETSRVVRMLHEKGEAVAASFDAGKIKLYVSKHPELLTAVTVGGVMVAGAVYLIEKRKKGKGAKQK